ncbi:MAG: 3'(2'),5'-bisphosphate nucleotidase CysQ [Pseudolabrys sp.]|nr:3'(2'),5'-bisphosphate nucleotidase CysQ [Pseudolabrys sp.]
MRRRSVWRGSRLPDSERAALRDKLAAVMREAGEIALASSKRAFKHWTKDGDSPVSEADIAVNDFLLAHLPSLVPGAGWLSEETEDDLARMSSAAIWVVDPIDGTRAFIQGRPDWSIAVALVEDGRPTVAAIYAPITGEMFLGARGEGATVNGRRLQVSASGTLNGIRLAGPQSYLKRLAQLNSHILPQPKIHSLALRITRVAAGELDAAFASRNSHDWDLAAADLLVHEAGGILSDFSGRALRYNQAETKHGALIAAGTERHRALVELVRDRAAEFA